MILRILLKIINKWWAKFRSLLKIKSLPRYLPTPNKRLGRIWIVCLAKAIVKMMMGTALQLKGEIDRCLREGWCQREYLMPMVTDPILCLPAWADGLAVFCLGAGTQIDFPGPVACTPQTMTARTGANPSQRCHCVSTLQLLADIWLCICGALQNWWS